MELVFLISEFYSSSQSEDNDSDISEVNDTDSKPEINIDGLKLQDSKDNNSEKSSKSSVKDSLASDDKQTLKETEKENKEKIEHLLKSKENKKEIIVNKNEKYVFIESDDSSDDDDEKYDWYVPEDKNNYFSLSTASNCS